jgi:hypothetical protein
MTTASATEVIFCHKEPAKDLLQRKARLAKGALSACASVADRAYLAASSSPVFDSGRLI